MFLALRNFRPAIEICIKIISFKSKNFWTKAVPDLRSALIFADLPKKTTQVNLTEKNFNSGPETEIIFDIQFELENFNWFHGFFLKWII